jgi:hypothetical protein
MGTMGNKNVFDYDVTRYFDETNNLRKSAQTISQVSSTNDDDDGLEACRVVIQNKVDYHHEVIESAVLQYPLTTNHLNSKNCSKTKPIIYDFALLNARFGKYEYETVTGSKSNHLNETEFWTWRNYYEFRLQNKTFERYDGRQMVYGELIEYDALLKRRVDMLIDITAVETPVVYRWLKESEDRFCIIHGSCGPCDEFVFGRTCFLTPVMWTDEQCSFFPSKFPTFDEKQIADGRIKYAGEGEPANSVRVCVMGSGRSHNETAMLFESLPYEEYNTYFHVASRNEFSRNKVQSYYSKMDEQKKRMNFLIEKDYEGFANWVSTCDISLLGIDPISTPSKFPPSIVGSKSQKKLTGPLPMIVAYETAMVVHEEFEKMYHDYFRGPIGTYNDTFDSYREALTSMIKEVYQNKTARG